MEVKIKNNVNELIMLLDEITLCFYQQKKEEGYSKLDCVLSKLSDVMDEIVYIKDTNKEIPVDIIKLNKALNLGLHALQENDIVMFSDVMHFEFVEQLNEIRRFL